MEAESNMTGVRVEVSISLRAFVLTVSAASAAVAIRMAERWRRYEQYSPFWQVRPRVSSIPPRLFMAMDRSRWRVYAQAV